MGRVAKSPGCQMSQSDLAGIFGPAVVGCSEIHDQTTADSAAQQSVSFSLNNLHIGRMIEFALA